MCETFWVRFKSWGVLIGWHVEKNRLNFNINASMPLYVMGFTNIINLKRVEHGWHSKLFLLGAMFHYTDYTLLSRYLEYTLKILGDLFVLRGQTECSIWWAFSLWSERSQRLCRVFDNGQHWLGPSKVPQMHSVSETHNSQYHRFVVNMCPFLANGHWMWLDSFQRWKVTFPFQTLDFQWVWFFQFPSSEWIPMI